MPKSAIHLRNPEDSIELLLIHSSHLFPFPFTSRAFVRQSGLIKNRHEDHFEHVNDSPQIPHTFLVSDDQTTLTLDEATAFPFTCDRQVFKIKLHECDIQHFKSKFQMGKVLEVYAFVRLN